jgi:hypothetical protein
MPLINSTNTTDSQIVEEIIMKETLAVSKCMKEEYRCSCCTEKLTDPLKKAACSADPVKNSSMKYVSYNETFCA